jgi:hypothetical protein
MERITQKQDDLLLQFLDGTLSSVDKGELENLLAKNPYLQIRLEELRHVHSVLAGKASLEQPFKLFTERVMGNLDQMPQQSTLSPKNGFLLLCGILVAVGVMTLFLSSGVFDNLNDTISLSNLARDNKFIKNPLPTISLNGKWVLNGILVLTMGIAFVLLDRTILKPYFHRRTGMNF